MKISGEAPTGAMIAATPRGSWDLAIEGGEESSALHVTLKFLGKAIDFDKAQQSVIKHLMRRFVTGRTSFDALVTGVERFGKDGDAIALTLDCPELVVLHEDAHTITPLIPLTWPTYKPHMTMMYDESGKKPIPKELTALVGSTITFDTILVAFGSDRDYIYLSSDDDLGIMKKKGNGRDYTIPSPLSTPKEIVGSHGHGPAGTSIRWPAMYRELRKKGYSKRKAAMISNGKWRRKHGMGHATARGAVELAKMSAIENGGSRRLPAMTLNTDDFPFAQTEILKAGTRAGAIKGWITRRRNSGISMDKIISDGRAKYGDDFDKYAPKDVAQHMAVQRMGRQTRGRAVQRTAPEGMKQKPFPDTPAMQQAAKIRGRRTWSGRIAEHEKKIGRSVTDTELVQAKKRSEELAAKEPISPGQTTYLRADGTRSRLITRAHIMQALEEATKTPTRSTDIAPQWDNWKPHGPSGH